MAERQDPYRNFYFKVEIDGIQQAGFTDCSGIGSTTDPIEYREGGMTKSVIKLPGITKFNNLTLKWGMSVSRDLYDWYNDIVGGKITRKHGSVVIYDIDGVTERVRWNFYNAWPTKWEGPALTGKGNDVAIETLELAVETIERAA
jgi:phage tail-like protein